MISYEYRIIIWAIIFTLRFKCKFIFHYVYNSVCITFNYSSRRCASRHDVYAWMITLKCQWSEDICEKGKRWKDKLIYCVHFQKLTCAWTLNLRRNFTHFVCIHAPLFSIIFILGSKINIYLQYLAHSLLNAICLNINFMEL